MSKSGAPVFYDATPDTLWAEVPGDERDRRRTPGVYTDHDSTDEDGIRMATFTAYDAKGFVGGLYVFAQAGQAPELSIVIRPDARRLGWGKRLYALAAAAGIDIEAGSDRALSAGEMTREGYAFMAARRRPC
jgi:GNAT superfamily N-acetyltransferase